MGPDYCGLSPSPVPWWVAEAVGTPQAVSGCPFLWGVLTRGRVHQEGDCRLAAPGSVACPILPSPRLATSEAPDAMEEWDVPQMKKEVESLKYQLAFKREMSSKFFLLYKL